MIGPHVANAALIEVAKFDGVRLIGPAIRQPAGGTVAGEVHGQGDITALCPMLGPILEGFSAAAVDQHHGRRLSGHRICGTRQISEDARWLAQERFTPRKKFLNETIGGAPT
jgi:hypothetical protein